MLIQLLKNVGLVLSNFYSSKPKSKSKIVKYKKKNIPKIMYKLVWETYKGNNYFVNCHCCQQTKISPFTFHCGHVNAEKSGGDISVHNLRPI